MIDYLKNRISDSKSLMQNENNIINMVRYNNPKFSSARFKQKAYACLRYVFFSYVKSDPSVCRSFVTDRMYNNICDDVDVCRRNNTVRIVDRFVLYNAFLTNYSVNDGVEKLGFYVCVDYREYYKKIEEKRIPNFLEEGINIKRYYLEFVKKVGVEHVNEIDTTNCPNCGAVLNVDSSGVCEYCKELVTTGKYCWILDKMCDWDSRLGGVNNG